jgi:hypothetical protein
MKPKQFDLVQIRELAAKKENWRFREFLKGSDLEPEDIDSRVAEIT